MTQGIAEVTDPATGEVRLKRFKPIRSVAGRTEICRDTNYLRPSGAGLPLEWIAGRADRDLAPVLVLIVSEAPRACHRRQARYNCGKTGRDHLDTTRFFGVDGCRVGWVVAMGDADLTNIRFAIHPTFTQVLESAPRPGAMIAIDVPIGLANDGPREADLAARRFLPRQRKSSVFAAPCRATLEATSYAEAGALNRQARGTGVSIELYNILPKIREVDAAMTPTLQEWVREVHPEVVFAALAGPQAAELPRKKERDGLLARLDLLAHQGAADLTLQRITEERRILARQVGSAGIAPDDLVDALAGLIAARRIATGQAIVLPPGAPQRDARGLRMEIIG